MAASSLLLRQRATGGAASCVSSDIDGRLLSKKGSGLTGLVLGKCSVGCLSVWHEATPSVLTGYEARWPASVLPRLTEGNWQRFCLGYCLCSTCGRRAGGRFGAREGLPARRGGRLL